MVNGFFHGGKMSLTTPPAVHAPMSPAAHDGSFKFDLFR